MWDKIQIFGVHALWKPEIVFVTILLGLLYYFFTGPLKHVTGLEKEPPIKQKVFAYSAIVLFYVVKGSPLYLLSHISLLAHMGTMAILWFIIAPLAIKGIPELWWRKLFNMKVIGKFLKFATYPLVAILVFNLSFSIYHLPGVLDFSKSGLFVHWFFTLFIFFAAIFMWWPLITPLKERDTIPPLYKVFYIFGNSLLITPACALIIFAGTPLYATYSEPDAFAMAMELCIPPDVLQGMNLGGPQIFLKMSLLHDQQGAGILMKVLQEVIFGFLIARIFVKWFRKENSKIDPIPTGENAIQHYKYE